MTRIAGKALAVAVYLSLAGVPASADSREDVKAAHQVMTTAAGNVKSNIDSALQLIREITSENAEQKSDEVLGTIDSIESEALSVLDQLALNGPFMNSLDSARVEIRKTISTVERMPQGSNRDRNLSMLLQQAERFDELQTNIRSKEGEITNLIANFARLRRDIQVNIRVGQIGELISNLEVVSENLETMTDTLNTVLEFDVSGVTEPVAVVTE